MRSWFFTAAIANEGAYFCEGVAFFSAAAVEHGGGDIDEEVDVLLALLDVALDVGAAGAGGDFPVHGADVVAGLVEADVFELDATAAEYGAILTGEEVLDGTAAFDLKLVETAL